MREFSQSMGEYSKSGKIDLMNLSGEIVPIHCTWIGGDKLKKFLLDMYGPNA